MRRRWLFLAVLVGIVLYALPHALAVTPYDDAYFFLRLGRNFATQGVFAWNLTEGSVHGATSQLFQVIAASLLALAPDHYVTAIRVFLATCIVLGGSLWMAAAARETRRPEDGTLLALGVAACPL